MRAALTVWGNRMSPVFEAARKLCVVEVEERKVISKAYETFDPGRISRLLDRLQELRVKTLICGAITENVAFFIQSAGIELIPFVSGTIDEVLTAYAQGVSLRGTFLMPGCRPGQCRRHRKRGSDDRRG